MDITTVYSTLVAATARSNRLQQDEAEKLLHTYETIPGFISALLAILQRPDIYNNSDARLLGIINLKNIVRTNWSR